MTAEQKDEKGKWQGPLALGGMEIMEPAITRRTNEQWNKGGIQIV